MAEAVPVHLALHAMATRFEVVLYGQNGQALRAAGEEALAEISRLESQLSLYRETSEIAFVNAAAANRAVRVSPEVFALLERAFALSRETGGAFDITIAPLLRCWGFIGGSGAEPAVGEIAKAREKVGMQYLRLDAEHLTVRFDRPGMMLDLGAIGKGYAIERAAEILREAGVESALIHGGTSTVYALGQPPGATGWRVGLETPPQVRTLLGEAEMPELHLCNEALSVSGVHGKCFEMDGKLLGHILDPRTGWPVQGCVMAAVVLPSATETDALSTGLLVGGEATRELLVQNRAGLRSLMVVPEEGGYRMARHRFDRDEHEV